MPSYAAIVDAFAERGLMVRGGFYPTPLDPVPTLSDGAPVRTLVLIGNAGGAMWRHFAGERRDEPHPLDAWTRRIVAPIAVGSDATAVYPSDRPFQPFQRWALRAEPVYPSPIGLLIHPDFGLWHAYRAALLFAEFVPGVPSSDDRPAPCDTCSGRPCLSACPVGAFSASGYDVGACAGHLASAAAPRCRALGCRAREACPVAPEHRYEAAQIGFHMAAFARSRASS